MEAEQQESTAQFSVAWATATGSIPGTMRVSNSALRWSRASGGQATEIPLEDVEDLRWLHVSGGNGVLELTKVGSRELVRLGGMRARDAESIRQATGCDMPEYTQAVKGSNYGSIDVGSGALRFTDDGKEAFALSLSHIRSVDTPSKSEVSLELGGKPSEGALSGDYLAEISFHVPNPSREWGGEGENDDEPYKTLAAAINDAAGASEQEREAAVWDLPESITALSPRGRFSVSVRPDVLHLKGTTEFKVSWESVTRIFCLQRPNQPQTLVIVSLDGAIRKGQTRYQHMVLAFPNDETSELDVSESFSELVQTREKLESTYSGPQAEVFARLCRGLSGCKMTREGSFRASAGTGPAIKCSYKAEEGFLFVLEKGIFFLPKPPVLLQHDNIEGIRFQRHGGALATARMFDVTITATGSDYSFANLARVEFDNFVKFLEAKQVPLLNLEEAKEQIAGSTAGTGGMAVDMDEGDEDEEDEEYAPAQEGVGEEDEDGNEEVEEGGE
jgi:structure-specific recognition protein 1